jgi:hypothetical protein
LYYYRLITVIDLFKFSNSYKATHRLCKLSSDPVKQQQCKAYLLKHQDGASDPSEYSAQLQKLPPAKLFSFFTGLTSQVTSEGAVAQPTDNSVKAFVLKHYSVDFKDGIGEYLLSDPGCVTVFMKRLVEYGVIKRYIEPINRP